MSTMDSSNVQVSKGSAVGNGVTPSNIASIPPQSPSHAGFSDLYKPVMHSSEHPPIMLSASWTQAVPYKEQRYHRTPSESIANNYTPSVSSLRLQDLARRYEPLPPPPRRAGTARQSSPRKAPSPTRSPLSPRKVAPLRDISRSAVRRKDPSLRDVAVDTAMFPDAQRSIMARQEQMEVARRGVPTDKDLERYYYYVEHGVYGKMLAPAESAQWERVLRLLPEQLVGNRALAKMLPELRDESLGDYDFSLRRAIVDYILEDPAERRRLRVACVPRPFAVRTVRAPVPWHAAFQQAQASATSDLFSIHPMMLHVHRLWLEQYAGY